MKKYNVICDNYYYNNVTDKVYIITAIIYINGILVINLYYDHKGRLKEIKSSNGHHYIIKNRLFKKKVINDKMYNLFYIKTRNIPSLYFI